MPIIRHGSVQDAYWTYSFSSIYDPSAKNDVDGVLVLCTETTARFSPDWAVEANAKAA